MRTASMAASKQCDGVMAATMGTGASPWRPYMAWRRSDCSVLVGSPVEGPPRWMSTMSRGSSRETAMPIDSDFRSMPGPLVVVMPEGPAEGGPDGGAHPGDLVLGLEGPDPELLVLGQLVEDVRGRGDGIGAEEDGQLGLVGGGDQAPGQGRVAGDVGVGPRLVDGRADLVVRLEELGRLAEVEAGLEGPGVGVEDLRGLGEALGDPLQGGLGGPGVEPGQKAEGEEVLRPLGLPGLHPGQLAHLHGERGHGDLVDRVGGQGVVDQRVGGVARLVQGTLVEGVDVHDDGAARGDEMTVGLEGGRVHGHQHRRARRPG